jgi:hypothetical protein
MRSHVMQIAWITRVYRGYLVYLRTTRRIHHQLRYRTIVQKLAALSRVAREIAHSTLNQLQSVLFFRYRALAVLEIDHRCRARYHGVNGL